MEIDDLSTALAATVWSARATRGLTVAELADASGVSRAMIAKVERGEAMPTAALLARLSAALGMTLSELVAQAEGGSVRVASAADQQVWSDPEIGYTRRALSPPAGKSLELVEVELPQGREVSYPAEAYRFADQLVWVLRGRLQFTEGEHVHELGAGDCLQLGAAADCRFKNPTRSACRYLFVLGKRSRFRAHHDF